MTKTFIAKITVLGIDIFLLGFITCFWWHGRSEQVEPVQITVAPAPAVAKTQVVTTPACESKTYTVPPKGDRINSLWRVAEQMYSGRVYLYPLIAEVNGIEAPYVIHPGQVLTIPMSLCDLSQLVKAPVESTRRTGVARVSSPVTMQKPAVVEVPTGSSSAPASAPVQVAQTVPAPTTAPVASAPAIATPAVVPTPAVSETAPAPASVAQTSNTVVSSVAPVRPRLEVQQTLGHVKPDLPLLTPGSTWNSFGTTPVESGNWINQFHFDQGIVLARPAGLNVEPYVALNVTQDSRGFSWNNKTKVEAGVKLAKPLSHGVMNVSLAYASERREAVDGRPSETRSGLTLFHDAWFGWDQPTNSSQRNYFSATPGTVWWVVGNVSPFEKGNVIGLARAEQGVTAVKAGGISFIPTAWAQAGFDSKDNPWNNRYTLGGGLKIAIPWKTGTIGVQGGYECTQSYDQVASTSATCGPAVRMDFWTGWRRVRR